MGASVRVSKPLCLDVGRDIGFLLVPFYSTRSSVVTDGNRRTEELGEQMKRARLGVIRAVLFSQMLS